jgi:hypothetical protein
MKLPNYDSPFALICNKFYHHVDFTQYNYGLCDHVYLHKYENLFFYLYELHRARHSEKPQATQ